MIENPHFQEGESGWLLDETGAVLPLDNGSIDKINVELRVDGKSFNGQSILSQLLMEMERRREEMAIDGRGGRSVLYSFQAPGDEGASVTASISPGTAFLPEGARLVFRNKGEYEVVTSRMGLEDGILALLNFPSRAHF